MKKVLFVATVTEHINAFHIPYLKLFKDNGYEVHVASNGEEKIEYCDKHYNLPFERKPFKKENFDAYKKLKKIINNNEYKIIHCHTPVGGVLTRLSAKKARRKGTKVIYTAHGFHFYKGAPILNWIIYYPVEKMMAKYTDCLITINEEDYEIAKKKLKVKQIELIHGVGVDESKFNIIMTEEEKIQFKKSLNIKEDDIVVTYVAELNKNKNQIMLIKAIKELVREKYNIKLLLIGKGKNRDFLENEIKRNNLEDNIYLLGYRRDIPKLLKISDLYVSTSKREGLPVNVIEAIISGLPIILTDCRGNRDLAKKQKNGFIIKCDDTKSLVEDIKKIIHNPNKEKIDMNEFYLNQIEKNMINIYNLK